MSGFSLADARAELQRVFGYPAFRPGQSAAVLSVLRGRDTVVILPTGGGKSLCYQVPAVMSPGLTVVISPLISLMRDQVRALRARGVSAAYINSAISQSEASAVLVGAAEGRLKLLYLAPERFDSADFVGRLSASISVLAVDEAHCISQWGHDFRPSYRRLAEVRKSLGWPPTIALTATATPQVRADIASQLALQNPTVIVTGFDRINLEYSAKSAKNDAVKAPLILQAVKASTGSSIVYASTKSAVDRIAASLIAAGVKAGAYHAGLEIDRRRKTQDAFMSGDVKTIVATNAFGMGIDKPDVRTVVHHSMPGNLEAYYQEAGRAGRDGKPSRVLLLHAYADRFTHEFFISNANPPRSAVEAVFSVLQSAAATGRLTAGPADIVLPKGGKISSRQVEAAVRILISARAIAIEPTENSIVRTRLLATPARITAELGGGEAMELGLLRAIWKSRGKELLTGADVDLLALPPGLNGAGIAIPLLGALQAKQLIHWTRAGGGLRLTHRRRPLESYPIDWSSLERRKAAEVKKLDTMQQYARTRFCRRAFFLRYFGEMPKSRRCSSCDNCR